jgi:hypothetical protein
MGEHRDPRLGAAVDDASAEGDVVVEAERNLHRCDRGELERLVELAPVDVGEPHAPDEAVVDEPGQRTYGGGPRRPRIGCVEQVEVDRQAVESGQARLAVGADRLRAAVGSPPALERCHPTLGHDPRGPVRAAATESAGQQRLVVAVGPRGVEHRDARRGGGRDRRERVLLVAVVVRRQAHAAETDSELRRRQPDWTSQATERTWASTRSSGLGTWAGSSASTSRRA